MSSPPPLYPAASNWQHLLLLLPLLLVSSLAQLLVSNAPALSDVLNNPPTYPLIPACLLQFELLANAGCRSTVANMTVNGVRASWVFESNTDYHGKQ
jgi:hypothetical protein